MLHSVPPAARLTRTCVVFVHKEKCLFWCFFVLEVFLYISLFFLFHVSIDKIKVNSCYFFNEMVCQNCANVK